MSLNTNPNLTNISPIRSPKPTVEWAFPLDGEPLRQCDVLQTADADDSLNSSMFLVMTADCDLVQRKHLGQILVVPILDIDTYVIKFRLPLRKEVIQLKTRLTESLGRVVNDALETVGKSPISLESAIDWYHESRVVGVFDTLRGYKISDPINFEQTFQLGIRLDEARQRWDSATSLELYTTAVSDTQELLSRESKDFSDFRSVVADTVRNFVGSNAPKDVYLLSELSPKLKHGYVAALRFPTMISADQISPIPGNTNAPYRRVTSVVPPYSFSIASQFGALFTAIGLPDEQRDSVKLMGELRIATFSEKAKI